MAVLNVSTSNNFPFPNFCNPKIPPNHKKLTTPFHRNPFSLYLSSSITTKFRTFAHFGRPSNRRNALRKKLLRDHRQVRPNQIPVDPSSVSDNRVEVSDAGVQTVDNVVEVEKPKSKLLGESVLLNKLENWVDQYKKDIEYWGIGSGPIFTVYQDSIGGVKRVSVDEEEILSRSRVQRDVIEDFPEVSRKILNAKSLAREMEIGNNVIARNSSVAKFVVQGEEEGGFVKAVRGFLDQPGLLPKVSAVGSKVLYVLVVLWAVKKLFGFGEKEVQHTEVEKEMMRRKIKARKEKEMLRKGTVEVIPKPLETSVVDIKKPKLDKEQLRKNIQKAKGSVDKLVVQNSSTKLSASSVDMDYKVQEIREMARRAREIEARDQSLVNRDMEKDDLVIEKSSNAIEDVKNNSEQDNNSGNNQNEVDGKTVDGNLIPHTPVDVTEKFDHSILQKVAPEGECNLYASEVTVPGGREINKQEIEFTVNVVHLKGGEENKRLDTPINGLSLANGSSVNKKPRIIRSVKEARDYLLKKHDKQVPVTGSKTELVKEKIADLKSSTVNDFNDQKRKDPEMNTVVPGSDTLNGMSDLKPAVNASKDSNQKYNELDLTINEDSCIGPGLEDLKKPEVTSDHQVNGKTRLSVKTDDWLGRNIHEIEPIIEQIRDNGLRGISDSNPALNPDEDSNQKDKEFSPTKGDCFKHSGVEPGVGDLPKLENTLDDHGKVNGLTTEAKLSGKTDDCLEKNFHEVEPVIEQIRSDSLNGISDSKSSINPSEDSNTKKEFGPTKDDYFKDSGVEPGVGDLKKPDTTSDSKVNGFSKETKLSGNAENWLEKSFHEVEPIVKQIRAGFRNNYMVAKERFDQPLDIPTELESLGVVEDGGELDWMQDDHLRDIVFRVRENELSGRDPFYLMNAEDKDAFFRGLEKKVEKENKKLSYLHEWLHSNIENLDYGADGISLYDPPEKIIPRWKGPPVEKIPQFLNEFLEKRKVSSTRNMNPVKKDENGIAEKSDDSSLQEKVDGSIAPNKKLKNPKTVIEGSDGSVKVGKKSGKEYWQHTKKWSDGFLQSYNTETDPEVKSIMKDIGKDLDRWITEKEIEEAADLMNKLPDRNKSIMEKKLNKLKREMELFGPQAVVSKYREYADDKEEDYLWWLDLSHVLCIEMYTIDDGEERVGFYSLEMAEDLELEPKPYHVIAFQDAGDCKNMCYIIQAHLEMLGKGNAFVVARPPKDAFREAKANGFGVTVIKKGELQLNIDQPLEEVEEQITEIGSKMYHDMMMKERSVDINSLMKGVFGFSDSTTKRLKRKLKKPRKG